MAPKSIELLIRGQKDYNVHQDITKKQTISQEIGNEMIYRLQAQNPNNRQCANSIGLTNVFELTKGRSYKKEAKMSNQLKKGKACSRELRTFYFNDEKSLQGRTTSCTHPHRLNPGPVKSAPSTQIG